MRVQTMSPTRYKVVLNGERPYSIWPGRATARPAGVTKTSTARARSASTG